MTAQTAPQSPSAMVASVEAWITARAVHFTASYRLPIAATDDLAQEGRIAAWKSAQNFNPSYGVKFLSFCSIGIDRRMMRWARRYRTQLTVPDNVRLTIDSVSFNQDLENDKGDGCTMTELISDQTPNLIEKPSYNTDREVVAEAVLAAVATLSPRDREIIVAHFLEGKTLREIAPAYGVTFQRIQQIIFSALRRLRHRIPAEFAQH